MESEALPLDYTRPAVRTSVPGPASKLLLDRQARRESNARTYPRRLPIAIRRARGSYVEDVDGNVFIDFLTGAGVLSLGHNHPEVVDAVRRQLDLLAHGLDFPTPVKDEFTSIQISLLPEGMRDRTKIHFCGPTGANAVEAAVKLCKIYTGRSRIVSFSGAFHGSPHGALALSGLSGQVERLANLMPGVSFFPYSHCFRCPVGLHPDTCSTNCAGMLEQSLKDPLSGLGKPAAVVVELIQGEGGVVPATLEFAQIVRRVTQELDIPLIVDEIQTGCGRTGTWYAFEQYDIVPDVIVASKGLAGIGMPLALILYDERLDVWAPGAHIGTFRGNQLAFAAGVVTAHIVKRDRVLANVVEQGAYIMGRLRSLAKRSRVIGDVRGKGLMIGMEIVDSESLQPDGRRAGAIQRSALERGLIVEVGGRGDAVVRMLPPLNVTREVATAAVDILSDALGEAEAEPKDGDVVHRGPPTRENGVVRLASTMASWPTGEGAQQDARAE
jgi:diaminobutyrate-2-oxoglutarate transaminase